MNSNWNRWIYTSVLKHFEIAASLVPLHMYIEGTKRETKNQSKYIEFRFDGPYPEIIRKNDFKIISSVNILYSVDMDTNPFNEYLTLSGWICSLMTDICAYKYGNGDTFLGTLKQRKPIRISHFGQISPDVRIIQGTVESEYCIYLTE